MAERLELGHRRRTRVGRHASPVRARRAADATTWLALGLLVAAVLTLTSRAADHRHDVVAIKAAPTPTTMATGRTAPPSQTTPMTATAAAPPVTEATIGDHRRASTPTTAAPQRSTASSASPTTLPDKPVSATGRAHVAALAPRVEDGALTPRGTLYYPDDIATRYGFRTAGGVVSAHLRSTGDTAVSLRLSCSGSRAKATGIGFTVLSAHVVAGNCVLVVSEPASPSSALVSYSISVHFPVDVTSSR